MAATADHPPALRGDLIIKKGCSSIDMAKRRGMLPTVPYPSSAKPCQLMADIARNARRNLILERPRCTSAFQVAISMTLLLGVK